VEDGDVRAGVWCRVPDGQVGFCGGVQLRVELDAHDALEGRIRRQHDDAALAGADVEKGEVRQRVGRDGERLLPAVQDAAKGGGRCAPVGVDVIVVRVAGGELVAKEQAAGVDAMLLVKGVRRDWGRKELAVDALADQAQGPAGSVGAQSLAEACDQRG